MKSAKPGVSTSVIEVTNISAHGFWLFIKDTEYFIPFEQFPWFRNSTIVKLLKVEMPSPNHLHWPELDVDLAVESLIHPERYPLVSRSFSLQDN